MKAKVERAYVDHQITLNHISAEGADAATEAEFLALDAKREAAKAELDARVLAIFNAFEQFSFIYAADRPDKADDYVSILGVIKNKRFFRWIRSE